MVLLQELLSVGTFGKCFSTLAHRVGKAYYVLSAGLFLASHPHKQPCLAHLFVTILSLLTCTFSVVSRYSGALLQT